MEALRVGNLGPMFSVPELAHLNGRVIGPHDPAYDQARGVFYGGIDRRPAMIIRVREASDVSRVVALARETGLELAVRSGGHSSRVTASPTAGSCSTSRTCGSWRSMPKDSPRGPRPDRPRASTRRRPGRAASLPASTTAAR